MDTTRKIIALLGTRDMLFNVLDDAQSRGRGKRPDWIEFERLTMFEAVNRARAAAGKSAISLARLTVAERMALGSDYSRKFALYCAELVHS